MNKVNMILIHQSPKQSALTIIITQKELVSSLRSHSQDRMVFLQLRKYQKVWVSHHILIDNIISYYFF